MTEAVKNYQANQLAPGERSEIEMDSLHLPAGAPLALHGVRIAYFVPVSFVAKDWKVTSRRIRALLTASRLEGRRQENGYWEVAYPYRFTFGQRGPALKRQQRPEKPQIKSELRAV